jgi:hypothetical protein
VYDIRYHISRISKCLFVLAQCLWVSYFYHTYAFPNYDFKKVISPSLKSVPSHLRLLGRQHTSVKSKQYKFPSFLWNSGLKIICLFLFFSNCELEGFSCGHLLLHTHCQWLLYIQHFFFLFVDYTGSSITCVRCPDYCLLTEPQGLNHLYFVAICWWKFELRAFDD